jgi:hypothetical protein
MGRYPAEIAEIAEVYWEGGKGTHIGAVFNNCLGLLNRYNRKYPPKKSRLQSMEPTHPIGWSKTSPRPLREAFRVRMGRSG